MIKLLVKKEILQEIKSKESILSMVIFGITIILILGFTIHPNKVDFYNIIPGIFWLTYLFTTIIGLLRLFNSEKEMNAFGMLLCSPIDRGDIYLGKMIAMWFFIILTQIITIPFFIIMFNFRLPENLISFILFILLTDWALSSVGTSVSCLGMRTRIGEILVPMFLYPLLSPVLISAVSITKELMLGHSYINYSFWIMIILTFSIVFTLIGYFTFDIIADE